MVYMGFLMGLMGFMDLVLRTCRLILKLTSSRNPARRSFVSAKPVAPDPCFRVSGSRPQPEARARRASTGHLQTSNARGTPTRNWPVTPIAGTHQTLKWSKDGQACQGGIFAHNKRRLRNRQGAAVGTNQRPGLTPVPSSGAAPSETSARDSDGGTE